MTPMQRYIRAAALVRDLKEQGLDDSAEALVKAREEVLESWQALTVQDMTFARTTVVSRDE